MINYIAVFIGGGIGCLLRFMANNLYLRFFINSDKLYYITLGLNFIGSIIIGFLAITFLNKQDIPDYIRFALTVGFCGGLTTFSTFSLEVLKMLETGDFLNAAIYSVLSVVFCVSGAILGFYLAKTIF